MIKLFSTLALLLVFFKASAVDFPVIVSEYIDDVKIDVVISRADLDDMEPWVPFESPPRLSINEALSAVRAYIDVNLDYSGYSLAGIELKQLPQNESHWHYIVKIRKKQAGKTTPGFFVVLFNGKVVSAFREPDSIK